MAEAQIAARGRPHSPQLMPPRSATWRAVLVPLLVARLLILAVIVTLLVTHAYEGWDLGSALTQMWRGWDAQSFLRIADHGYPATLIPDDAFLPGYPLLVALLTAPLRWLSGSHPHWSSDGNYVADGAEVVAALLVSLVAEAVALWYIYRLLARERDQGDARFAVWCVALAPLALFFAAAYTESLFLAGAAASLYYMREGRFVPAALAGAVACGTRITGVALCVAFALEYLSQRHWRWRWDVVAVVLIPLPLLLYGLFMHVHVGDTLALLHANQLPSFNHSNALPWEGFRTTWNTLKSANGFEDSSIWWREIIFGLLGVLICIASWLAVRLPLSFAGYMTVVVLMSTSITFWRSMPRYDLALFPVVFLLADGLRLGRATFAVRAAVVTGSAVVMVLGAWLYLMGHWLG